MEAFVYCWTDHAKEMLYVGYHKGHIDDGYICSSKYMMNAYNKRSMDFTREIIDTGSAEDMFELESLILQEADVVNDDKYYNQSDNKALNGIPGGEKSKEHRANLSKALTGYKRTEEHKRNNRIAQSGRSLTDTHKRNMSASLKGKTWEEKYGIEGARKRREDHKKRRSERKELQK